MLRLFRGLYGERLQFNALNQSCELDGEPLDPDLVHVELGDRFNVRAGRENVVDTLNYLCKQRAYNPVVEYLDKVAAAVEPGDIDNMATKYLHISESDPLVALRNAQVRKFLICCVARAYRPGCKVDTALILQGRQNLWKSSFFRVLGGAWFDDSMGLIENKDDLMIAHKCWIQEWSEFDYVSGQRHASQIKAFLSRQSDTFRPPYGRSAKTYPRRFVICGTTNQTEFLNDPTGSRRFWVIPVSQLIDIQALERDRDAIWSAAVHAYRNGEQWWLTPDEFAQSEDANRDYQASDPWTDDIAAYVASRQSVTVKEILKALDVDSGQQTKAHENRIAAILKAQGWEKSRRSEGGTRQKCWKRETLGEKVVPGGTTNPETPAPSTLEPGTTPLNEVGPPGTTPGVSGANATEGLVPPLPDLVPPSTIPTGGVVPPKNPDNTGITADLVPPGTTPSPTLSQASEKTDAPGFASPVTDALVTRENLSVTPSSIDGDGHEGTRYRCHR
ncbi:MAG: hypothetical protein IGQ88_12320 [Gloeomargaritaceae cyanobacterium C42_A2020_066]|nr:hypothetical protein [Gloeomargaritaceae cyanobacterium C42_A2020_066]